VNVDRALIGKIGRLRVGLPGLAAGPQLGDRRSAVRGRGMEFADHRPYRAGDDLRLVDWNVYNRLRTLLVRLFHEDRNLHLGLCVDISASMSVGRPQKAEHAATLAAALALVGLRQRDTVTLALAGGADPRRTVIRGHQVSSFASVLAALEAARPGGRADLAPTLRSMTDRGRMDRLVLASDLLVDEATVEATVYALASSARHPVLLHVLDGSELHPDLRDGLEAEDAETGEIVQVGAGPAAARRYQEALQAYLTDVRERCAVRRVTYVAAFTTVPVRELVMDALRHGRVLESARGGAA
jgi:uncharacterized protein (DUF58 family)